MRRQALLCVLVVLAGCTVSVETTPDVGETASQVGTQQPGLGTDVGQSDDTILLATVTVTEVVDGDTIDVRYANGSTDTVRFLGIDTPEVHVENQPAEYEGVPDTDAGAACLREAGEAAGAALRERIADEEVQLVVDETADRRGGYGRLLAYVVSNGTDLNHWLVETGHARVYDSTFTRSDAYYAAESTAQSAERGLWSCRSVTATAS